MPPARGLTRLPSNRCAACHGTPFRQNALAGLNGTGLQLPQLRYYTDCAVKELWTRVPDCLDHYYALPGPRIQELVSDVRISRLSCPDLSFLESPAAYSSKADSRNALIVYDKLSDLSPRQASDARLWTHLCHHVCPRYVARRWLINRPLKNDVAIRRVRNHFFANGSRAFVRDNGLSRLRWLGKIANDVAPEDPDEFLTIVLHLQDVRSALIERPSISANTRVLRAIYSVMREHWQYDHKLFERKNFRKWMLALHQKSQLCLLDALPDDSLSELMRTEAESVLRS